MIITELLVQANQLIYNGLYALRENINSNTFSHFIYNDPPESIPITEYSETEIKLLRKKFTNAKLEWQEYNDFDLEEQCFFYADYLIPEVDFLTNPFNSQFFIKCVIFARARKLISHEYAKELENNADYYCNAVLKQRYKSNYYPLYKNIILTAEKYPDDNNKEQLALIPQEDRIQIEKEISSDRKFILSKALLLTWFTFLQLGIMQTRVYLPGNPNTPLDLNSIDIPETIATINAGLSLIINNLFLTYKIVETQLTVPLFGYIAYANAQFVTQNYFYQVLSELKDGDTNYPKALSNKICKVYDIINDYLSLYFQEMESKEKVLIVGEENHSLVSISRFILLNWLGHWVAKQNKTHSVTLIIENEDEPENSDADAFLASLNHELSIIQKQQNQRQYLLDIYQRYCINILNTENMSVAGISCAILLARSHGFNVIINNISPKLTRAEQIEIEKFYLYGYTSDLIFENLNNGKIQKISNFYQKLPSRIKYIDRKIAETTMKELQHQSNSIIVVFTGAVHMPMISKMLQAKGYHSLNLKLAASTFNELVNDNLEMSTKCIVPIEKCNKKSDEAEKLPTLTHCIETENYDSKHCDKKLHEVFSFFSKRFDQAESAKSIPNVFSNPNRFFHLMLPKACLKKEGDRQQKPTQNLRQEL